MMFSFYLCWLLQVVLFWSMKLHCTPPQQRVVPVHARKFVAVVMFVGEAPCRRGFEGDVNGGGNEDSVGCDDGGGGTDAVLATLTDRTEPLPHELWLHILTFLRVTELGVLGGEDATF